MLNDQYVLGYAQGNGKSVEPFNQVFTYKKDLNNGFKDVDCVIFWGGTDIHPSLYDEDAHPHNQVADEPFPSYRDEFEWKAMAYCIAKNIPMIGVCRGAQMGCAKAGGILIQDVKGHASGRHNVRTITGEVFSVTSAHHQMMYPFDVDHEMLAWAAQPLAGKHYEGAKGVSLWEDMRQRVEPEIVYFPKIRFLAIQGHPEWANVTSQFVEYCNELVCTKLLNLEIVK